MYQSPPLPGPRVVMVFPEGAVELWRKALARPEADMKCRAAEAVARAHRRSAPGLDKLVRPLLDALEQPDQQPAVRLAIARALVVLGVKEAAPGLFKQAQRGDGPLREIVEPALARWDYRPARAEWLGRLRDPRTPHRSLVLAIRGLAAVREGQAGDRLRELALSGRAPGPIRLEAARALGALRTAGLEKDAGQLAADGSPRGIVNRLAAASLLQGHRGEDAVGLLQKLARDPEPTVAAAAAGRLIAIDPRLALPALPQLLASADPKVRSLGVEVLFRQPTEKHVRLLADRLDDPHPDVRAGARRALHELASKKEFHDPVIAEGTRVLGGGQWRGLEQAAILLADLGHKPAGRRLVELLRADRPEVFVTAAWGLRRLAVPETLPGVVDYVRDELHRRQAWWWTPDTPFEQIDHQLSQLNQLMGLQKHRPADDVLRAFIPRADRRVGPEARAAAVWALGRIHQGKPPEGLAAALEDRLDDMPPGNPEDIRVRRMAAVSLGRLKAQAALPTLRKYFTDGKPSQDVVNNACGWAIGQITGKAMPAPGTMWKKQTDWFLVPNG